MIVDTMAVQTLYLQAVTVSDISNIKGDHIDPAKLQGICFLTPCPSNKNCAPAVLEVYADCQAQGMRQELPNRL